MVGKRLEELRAVAGHGVNAHVGDQHQQPRQRPPPRMPGCARRSLALQPPVGEPAQQRGEQGQKEQRMRLRPVAHHVEQVVAMVDHHVQIRQRACNGADQGCFAKGGTAAHDGHSHAGAEHGLGEGVHVL